MGKRRQEKVVPIWDRPTLKAKNERQKRYINAIRNHTIVVGTGYAGTGKSYIPAALAADMFVDSRTNIEKIIICRPNEGVGRQSIGMLKGDLNSKMIPWCAPILDVLKERLGEKRLEYMLEHGQVELLPCEYARGKSFNNAFVILDEAQNIDKESLKCIMLRIGLDSKLVIDGDIAQCDIGEATGLKGLLDLMDDYHMPVQHVDFGIDDIVRSDICRYLIEIFEQAKF